MVFHVGARVECADATGLSRDARCGRSGDAIEVCTSTGMVRVLLDESADPDKSEGMSLEGCPFCLLHDGQAALPPLKVTFPLVQPYDAMPPAFYEAAVTSSVWLTALSRGPPLLLA